MSDNGVGMSADELEKNLGTIARSGSLQFKEGMEKDSAADIIGQFGVGFYSAFMVSDEVAVITRRHGEDTAHCWKSSGADGYTIADVLVHDAHTQSNFLHQQLAMMDGYDLPLAIGVIRDVEAPTYDEGVSTQIEEVRAKKGFDTLRSMILAGETWEVK